MAVDLHVHTRASSDGEFSPREMVELAEKHQLQAIAITDHDAVSSIEEALYWGEQLGVEVIPGCEFSTVYQGKWLHVLGYFLDYQHPDVIALCRKVESARKNNVDAQLHKLREAGFFLEKAKVLEDTLQPLPISFGKAIFSDPRNAGNQQLTPYRQQGNPSLAFCMDWMIPGRPYNVPQYYPQTPEVLRLILHCGGVPILAHPGYNLGKEDEGIIFDLIRQGLAGLEAYTSWHDAGQEQYYEDFCRRAGILSTSGSDFHGKMKPDIQIGQVAKSDYQVLQRLKEKAAHRSGEVS